ncbi:hypothetical protein RRG08_054034 [Elysia crispata]|uniref:Uncharacterized protein n=1 Tax=Elysia crispata TaxID=231223 RepID=A0AAE1DD28_9GAST|nr:hypothetical protein RRG08_054034 [Elysia crispata]
MASSILSGRISHNSRDAAEMRVAPPCVQATLGTDSGFKAFTFHSWAAKHAAFLQVYLNLTQTCQIVHAEVDRRCIDSMPRDFDFQAHKEVNI